MSESVGEFWKAISIQQINVKSGLTFSSKTNFSKFEETKKRKKSKLFCCLKFLILNNENQTGSGLEPRAHKLGKKNKNYKSKLESWILKVWNPESYSLESWILSFGILNPTWILSPTGILNPNGILNPKSWNPNGILNPRGILNPESWILARILNHESWILSGILNDESWILTLTGILNPES